MRKWVMALGACVLLIPGVAQAKAYNYGKVNGMVFVGPLPASSPYVAAGKAALRGIHLGHIMYKGQIVAIFKPYAAIEFPGRNSGTSVATDIYPTKAFLNLSSTDQKNASLEVVRVAASTMAHAWALDTRYLQKARIPLGAK